MELSNKTSKELIELIDNLKYTLNPMCITFNITQNLCYFITSMRTMAGYFLGCPFSKPQGRACLADELVDDK